jgi:glyoxylase-like metal-dependent hydrolase (beta-lactamase superfamily II)
LSLRPVLARLSKLLDKPVSFAEDILNKSTKDMVKSMQDGDVLMLGNNEIKVIHTPGHSRGGLCFYISSTGWLISGDSLFEGSIGRTDLEGGSYATLIKSITEHLMILPEETVVYPGHGAYTTIGEEKKCNPFL